MYICIWPDWLWKNLHNGKNLSLYIFLAYFCGSRIPNVVAWSDVTLQTGPDGATEEQWGVNYRSLNDLFQISQKRRNAMAYEIAVQMVEIYNEQIRDLLSSNGPQKRYPQILYILSMLWPSFLTDSIFFFF